LAVTVTAANEQERDQVAALAGQVQKVTHHTVKVAFADQEYAGEKAAEAAQTLGIELEVVKHTETKKGFVLLPRRWVVERTFGWLGRFRRLARDYERLTTTLAGYHWIAFLGILLTRIISQSA
jgi:transposase